ncbi:NAD(P)-binding domain-containing protein [Termitidicoccus mucosus]|uniref:FAD-binding domain-containing protein n=1 Tax=Termitidicoccus mucosus TaxID=1184151 RepID=A0A178IKI8_9BACT|nr:hypothetical protein AW736_07910 [Opitutaceae bacterium TSB47]
MAAEHADPEKIMDVIAFGGGAAGVGVSLILKDLGIRRFGILEKHDLGASFRRWPKEMRFITPVFFANAFGLSDLNAVNTATSPADFNGNEHPWGQDYANDLTAVAAHYKLPLVTRCEVQETSKRAGGFQPNMNCALCGCRKAISMRISPAAGSPGQPRAGPWSFASGAI